MIRIEQTEVQGFEPAIRGMRNPMNSWEKSDSDRCCFDKYDDCDDSECPYREACSYGYSVYPYGYYIGPKDMELAMKLVKAGPVHAKFRRMMVVWVDVTAPLYWWKEFDTYKVGTVANSCSTMHKIQAKEFTLDDFSHEHLINGADESESNKFTAINIDGGTCLYSPIGLLQMTYGVLNRYRQLYLDTKDKKYWWQMIQLLPSSYNQKRTLMMNYEVLSNIYANRKDHKLDEWREFCEWIEKLPCSQLITTGKEELA